MGTDCGPTGKYSARTPAGACSSRAYRRLSVRAARRSIVDDPTDGAIGRLLDAHRTLKRPARHAEIGRMDPIAAMATTTAWLLTSVHVLAGP